MQKTETPVRWYERERWRYAADWEPIDELADWVKQVNWSFFCTFTFAWRVSDQQAEKTFVAFINRLERSLRCDVGYVRGDEKRFSGCGKPACARHYHALLACVAPVHASLVEFLWKSMAGNRSDDAGAEVEEYNSSENGARYVLKYINQPDGGWTFRNLELFQPEARRLQTVTVRWRRKLRRFKARQKKLA